MEIALYKGIVCAFLLSLPAWGAWIEIFLDDHYADGKWGRSPHGERGLKFIVKCSVTENISGSLPAWGAWIEMTRKPTVGWR